MDKSSGDKRHYIFFSFLTHLMCLFILSHSHFPNLSNAPGSISAHSSFCIYLIHARRSWLMKHTTELNEAIRGENGFIFLLNDNSDK